MAAGLAAGRVAAGWVTAGPGRSALLLATLAAVATAAARPLPFTVSGAVGFALAAAAVVAACRRFGAGWRSPWAALVGVLAIEATALAVRPLSPGATAALSVVSVAVAFEMIRRLARGAGIDPGPVADAAIVGTAMFALTVDLVWVPLAAGGFSRADVAAIVAVTAEVLVLTQLFYALLATGALRLWSVGLLSAGAVINALLHVAWAATGRSVSDVGPVMTAAHLTASLLMAAGALHPSMARPPADLPPHRRLTDVRLVVLGLCSLSPWVLLVISGLWAERPVWPLGLCGIVMGTLLVGRLSRALAARDEAHRRETSLRSGLTALLVAADDTTIELAVVLATRNLLGDRNAAVRLLTDCEALPRSATVFSASDREFRPPDDVLAALPFTPERPWLICVTVPTSKAVAGLLVASTATAPDAELLRSFQTLAGQVGLARERAAAAESMHRRHAEHRLAALVRHASDVITILDRGLAVQFQSPSVTTMLGHDPDRLHGTDFLHLVDPEERASVEAQLRHLVAGASLSTTRLDCRLRHHDSGWLDAEITATNLLDDPDVMGLVLNIHDVSERRVLEQQLIRQAFHDPLTGLANRALLADRVEHAVQGIRRGGAHPAVLFIDLDDFKTVNDSLGHQAGDRLLVEIGERLTQCLRPGDTAARVGGDEFAVLLTGAGQHGPEALIEVAQRVLAAIAEPLLIEGAEITPKASIGVAGGTEAGGGADLIRNADLAMYMAKGQGGGVAVYDPSMHDSARRRLELQSELVRALDRHEFEVHLQPIVGLHDTTGPVDPAALLETPPVLGMEALVRWKHPVRGMVSPVEFIPLAEETGLIVELGRWVMLEACRTVAGWARDGLSTKLSLTVNVSGRQLQEPSLVDDVAWAIHSSGIDPAWLVLEVTESVVMRDTASSIEQLQALKQLGVRIAIDDFGTGYSSLSYLQLFPIDVMKIDRSFVIGLGSDPKASGLVRALISLSDSFGMTTLAEGIETIEQLVELQRLGCDLGQGFGFARPMSGPALVESWEQGRLAMAHPGPAFARRVLSPRRG